MADKIIKPLRVALLTSSTIVQWKLNALQVAEQKGLIEIVGLIISNEHQLPEQNFFIHRFTNNDLNKKVTVNSIFSNLPGIANNDDAGKKKLNADLWFCTYDENSQIDDTFEFTRHGIWRLSFVADNRIVSEKYLLLSHIGSPYMALTINNEIMRCGTFRLLNHSWKKTLTNIYTQAQEWFVYCLMLHLNNNLTSKGKVDVACKDAVPNFLNQLSFVKKLFLNLCIQRFQLLFTKEVWNVGVIPKHISKCMDDNFTDEVIWFPHPTHGIFADPFGIETENSIKIIFENLDFKSNHGKLSVMEFDKKNYFKNGKTFLEGNEHLSYPYVFEDNGKLFVMPECCESGKLTLYEINRKDFSIISESVLIENIQAVDPSIIFYNNKWWLFCTLKNDSPDLKLHIYFSDSLTGNWQPHKLNPVKIDISSARPGGTMFIHLGKLYRPSQDSSTSYGDRIVINKIEELTENNFSEKEVATVLPSKIKNYKDGLHTVSAAGNFTLIDAKKVEVRINYNFFKKLFK